MRVVEDGDELHNVMKAEVWPTGIIIGGGLRKTSGMETALRAAREIGSKEQPKMPGCVFLITEVRADHEYLDFLRKHGFHDFVYRDDPPTATLTHITNGIHSDSRVEKRFPVKISVRLRVPGSGTRVDAMLENVSSRGAKVSAPKKKHVAELKVGDRIEIEITSEMRVGGIVRAVSQRNRLFYKGVALGVQFDADDEKVLQTVLNIHESELTNQMSSITSLSS